MFRSLLVGLVLLSSLQALAQNPASEKLLEIDGIRISSTDWPWWRGPHRNGVADANPLPPLTWSGTENLLWKTPVPGRGHGSPTVFGDRIYLATAESSNEVQGLACFDRATGKILWHTEVHRGGFEKKDNKKGSPASSSPACDGERVYINFLNSGAVTTSALSMDGKILWQTKIADFVSHQGFGSSPALYHSLVIASADNKGSGKGAIAGLERTTGKVVWRIDRPTVPNYTSPIILRIQEKDQLIFTGCDLVSSHEPLTGKKVWEIPGSTTECVTSTVTDGFRVFTSGGYPKNHMSAIEADGSGKIVWENKTRVYVPSLLVKDGHLYGVLDAGVASCWNSETGEELWKNRLGGTFSSSPVLVGDRIYAVNETGRMFVFKAQPNAFELLAENVLGDETYSTPTICGGRIYHRYATGSGEQRQEYLSCIATSKAN